MKIDWNEMSLEEKRDMEAVMCRFWKNKAEKLLQEIVEMEQELDSRKYREKFLEGYVDELKEKVKKLEKQQFFMNYCL